MKSGRNYPLGKEMTLKTLPQELAQWACLVLLLTLFSFLVSCGWMFRFQPDCSQGSCSLNPITPSTKATPVDFADTPAACKLHTIKPLSVPHVDSDGRVITRAGRSAIVLIHGIYSDRRTFGCLPYFLADDHPNYDIFSVEYWSSAFWPNLQRLYDLGTDLGLRLANLSDYQEIVLIAHSMGGLIARDAILKERSRLEAREARSSSEFLSRLSLVLIGTPNRGSMFAEVGTLIKSIVTLPLHVMINGSFPPYLIRYDRQLYDLPLDSIREFDLDIYAHGSSPFIRDLTLRWLDAFGPETVMSPNIYAIVGLHDKYPSDGIVSALNQLSVNILKENQYCIQGVSNNARHWNGIVNVRSKNHITYKLLRAILEHENESSYPCSLELGSTTVLLSKRHIIYSVYHNSPMSWFRSSVINWISWFRAMSGLVVLSFHENGFIEDPYHPKLDTDFYFNIGRLNLKNGESLKMDLHWPGPFYVEFMASEVQKSCSVTIQKQERDSAEHWGGILMYAVPEAVDKRVVFNLGVGMVNYLQLESVGAERIRLTLLGCREELGPQERVKREITGKDGAPMVHIPAGEFPMGSKNGNDLDADEEPPHSVNLDAFYIDKYEVTTSRYAAFMRESRGEEPEYWSDLNLVSQGDRPVVGVSWYDAYAYCEFYGKRLPTEAEWEKAARGTDGRIYPWGYEHPTEHHANFNKCCDFNKYRVLTPVGSLDAGASPYGAQDMAGNVLEWVADWYDENYYKVSPERNPVGASSGQSKVLRGGSWFFDARYLRSSNRNAAEPSTRYDDVGFRCGQDVG
jgi:formylglycine-generating enzyme required for sulfatase activity/pimeloyl-ACP methyl ester carboxylesterase